MRTTEKASFRPRARLLEILGEQLIKNHRLALFELVKNSYDADAKNVTIRFVNINSAKAKIVVRDDGLGMDKETIINSWLEPASNHRELERAKKIQNYNYDNDADGTSRPRLPLGEKGVGRFAVQKLGNTITLVTRKAGHKEVVVRIDWATLMNAKYLEQASVEIEEREPRRFLGNLSGTRIEISQLKDEWTRGDLRKAYRDIKAMTSPFKDLKDFDVKFKLKPEPKGWLDNVFTPEQAEQNGLFHFDFQLSDSGFSWTYRFTPYSAMTAEYPELVAREKINKNDLSFEFFNMSPPSGSAGWARREDRKSRASLEGLGIGPVAGRLIAYDLSTNVLRYLNVVGLKDYLRDQGGMRVYRDGMRVYDYGESGNDWLGLDVKRLTNPVGTLSNNLFVGEASLKLSKSQRLKEKTNREGFVENSAYHEFRYAIQNVLAVFEAEREKDRALMKTLFQEKKENLPKGIETPEAAISELRVKATKIQATELLPFIDKVERSYLETRDVLMKSVGAGLGLSVVFHEVERGVRGLVSAFERKEPVSLIQEKTQSLAEMLEIAATMVRTNSAETFKASTIVTQVLFLSQGRFIAHNIKAINGFSNSPLDFDIKGSRQMITAALNNLVDNAIHWVKVANQRGELRTIWIGPSDDIKNAIFVADNGPGFQDEPEQMIKPFITRRPEGMGLGLYYADMVMKAHKSNLIFPDATDLEVPSACSGAIVGMLFKNGEQRQGKA